MPKIVKNNVTEITDLLRNLPMSEIFGGKTLEEDYLNITIFDNKIAYLYQISVTILYLTLHIYI